MAQMQTWTWKSFIDLENHNNSLSTIRNDSNER